MPTSVKPFYCYLIVAAAFILYPFFYGIQVKPGGDTHDYIEAANIILNGYRQITFRVPIYPLILIATHSVDTLSVSLFWLQYLLYFGSVFLLVAAMLRSAINTKYVLVITVLLVLPLLVQMIYTAMTETVSFALANIIFATYVLARSKYKFLLIGLLVALLTLTRPSFQLAGILITIFLFFSQQKKISSLLFLVPFALPLVIFSFFNKERFNFFGVTPATGWHLTTKTALFIDQWPDRSMRPLMIRQRNESLVNKQSHTGSMFVWTLPGLLQDSLHMNYVNASVYMMKNNVALIKSHPLQYLSSVGRSVVDYTFPNAIAERNNGIIQVLYSVIQFFYVYLYLLLIIIAGVLAWLLKKRIDVGLMHPLVFGAILIFTNFFASVAAEIGSSRHRTPTEGLILVSIAFALPIVCRAKTLINQGLPS